MIAQLPTSEPSIGFNPAIHLSQPRLKRHICLEKKQFSTESVDHGELKNRVKLQQQSKVCAWRDATPRISPSGTSAHHLRCVYAAYGSRPARSVTVQIVRDWVERFNERGPAGLINGKAPGHPSKLNDTQRKALAKLVEAGPIPAVHGVVRWRRKDLAQWIFQEFRISIDETTVGRELKALGFAKLSARPRHYAQNEFEGEVFKKTSPPLWMRSGKSNRPAQTSKSGGPTKPG